MSNRTLDKEILTVARNALKDIGYLGNLLRDNYKFADFLEPSEPQRQIDIAGFAQEPVSIRSACIGVTLPRHDDIDAIRQYQSLGAPQILAIHPDLGEVRRWKILAQGEPTLIERFPIPELGPTIRAHRAEWNPEQVLRAKAISFAGTPVQLDFVDIGLLPALESEVHKRLDELLSKAIASGVKAYKARHGAEPDHQLLYRLVFRFIAAKLLGDRQHPGPWRNSDPSRIIKAVNDFYFSGTEAIPVLSDKHAQEVVWDEIARGFNFQNLSVEALASVYETTLLTPELRKKYGTHATPTAVAEFVIKHLPLENLPQDKRVIVEPFCGHAPFLTAALGKLRTLLPLNMDGSERHDYFVRMLTGLEIDAFASEVARCSLILADYPHSNGWNIENIDVFTSSRASKILAQAQVVVCNPPFGDFTSEERAAHENLHPSRAVESLRQVLNAEPKLLGLVLPRVFLQGRSFSDMRHRLDTLYDHIDIVTLPDNTFRYSEAETVLLLAHGERKEHAVRRYAQVKKQEYRSFIRTGHVEWVQTETLAPTALSEEPPSSNVPSFGPNPLKSVWEALSQFPKLGTLVSMHRGIEYNVRLNPSLFSDIPREGFAPGLQNVEDGFEPYIISRHKYLDVNPDLMKGNAYKLPWGREKVIANAWRLSRGPWRIAGALDEEGLVCYQNLIGIWRKGAVPIEVIAALLNSMVANAYLSTHNIDRDNQLRHIQQIPVPTLSDDQTKAMQTLVRQYQIIHRQQLEQQLEQPNKVEHFRSICEQLALVINLEVLKAYNLSAPVEQELRGYFEGQPLLGLFHPTGSLPEERRTLWNIDDEHGQTLQELDNLANANDEHSYLEAVSEIDWSRRSAIDFLDAIRLALSFGAHVTARNLSMQGVQLHPTDERIAKYANLLAPGKPSTGRRDSEPYQGLRANRDWLAAYSEQYRGQWVALRNGELLGVGSTPRQLTYQIDDPSDVLITKA